MDAQQQKRLDQLKAAWENGVIDEDTYRSAVAAIGAGERGVAAQTISGQALTGDDGRQVQTTTYVEHADTVYLTEQPVTLTAFERTSAEGRYLLHVINGCRYLHLQGIRAGGKLIDVELDRVYVRLHTAPVRGQGDEGTWLAAEAAVAPGERMRRPDVQAEAQAASQPVEAVLARHIRLVVLGDPGSGKTTLLRYLALHYARAGGGRRRAVPDRRRRSAPPADPDQPARCRALSAHPARRRRRRSRAAAAFSGAEPGERAHRRARRFLRRLAAHGRRCAALRRAG